MRDWLLRSHIAVQLREDDDHLCPAVHDHDARRAIDLLFTLVVGLSPDHLTPQPAWKRVTIAENAVAGMVAALGAALFAVALFVIAPMFPIWSIAVISLGAFVLVAARPGRSAPLRPAARRRTRPPAPPFRRTRRPGDSPQRPRPA